MVVNYTRVWRRDLWKRPDPAEKSKRARTPGPVTDTTWMLCKPTGRARPGGFVSRQRGRSFGDGGLAHGRASCARMRAGLDHATVGQMPLLRT